MKRLNLIGQCFGRLTVIEKGEETSSGQSMWICKCECGKKTKPIFGANLTRGHTKSCGCLRTKHNKHNTRLYEVWRGMKKRCYCTSDQAYKNYGGRGISVCEEWRDNFQAFYGWAMANGYNPSAKQGECTLDRIDVNGNYEPSNCRWVTMKVQQNNRRNNKKESV